MLTKPLSELREAFVRARFAEPTHFGDANVEEWLQAQRTAEKPDNDEWMTCIYSHEAMLRGGIADRIGALRMYAEPFESDWEIAIAGTLNLKFLPFLNAFRSDRFEVYFPYAAGPIVISKIPLRSFWISENTKVS